MAATRRRVELIKGWFVLAVACAILMAPACSSKHNQTESGSAKASAEQATASDPCSIATPEEMSRATGMSITTAKPGTPDGPIGCSYNGDTWVQVTIYDRRAAFDQRQSSQCGSSSRSIPTRSIPNLGADAVDCSPDLFVRVDAERGFLVACGMDINRDGCEAVGRMVAPRIAAMQ
jgi:hypothetical protein